MLTVYQGVQGSYGEQAAKNYFGDTARFTNAESFDDVVAKVVGREADFGVLPIENSSTGTINDVLDLLLKNDCYVIGEYILKIEHSLLGVKGATLDDIKEVYSHPQGFAQCSKFLAKHKEWQKVSYINTAYSAKFVGETRDKTKAAIAEKRNAEFYDLDILCEGINDNRSNHTRFAVIAAERGDIAGADKTSVALVLPHKSGSLYEAIGIFAKRGINLLKIESRPLPDINFEYMFYIDFAGSADSGEVSAAISEIKAMVPMFKLIGCYKSAK